MKKTTGRDWSATRATPVESPAPRSLLIRGARVLDPASGFDGTAHVGIRDGLISSFGAALPKQRFEQTINADGPWLLPGIVDLCARFREPGQTHKARFASETPAAPAGRTPPVCLPPARPPALPPPAPTHPTHRP